jgi:NACHT domain
MKSVKQVAGQPEPTYAPFDYLVECADGRPVTCPDGLTRASARPITTRCWAAIVELAPPEDLLAVARIARRRGAAATVLAKVGERLKRAGLDHSLAPERISIELAGRLREYLEKMACHPDLPELAGRYLDLPVKQRTDLHIHIGLAAPVEATSSEKLTVLEAIRSLQYCVLVGEPGSGKTTALQALADTLARELETSLDRLQIGQRQYLPVYVWLPRFDPVGDTPSDRIGELLYSAFQRVMTVDDETAKTILHRFRLALLLDGLNEMSEAHVDSFLDDLATFLREHGDHVVVIASRTQRFEGRLRIRPFHVLQMLELEYPDGVRQFLSGHLNGLGVRQVMTRLDENMPLRRLALNPLLLHMMVLIYLHEEELPASRGHLLDRIARGLLGQWEPDVRGSGVVGPGGEDCRECRHVLLRHLGYAMKRQGLQLPAEAVKEIFDTAADPSIHDRSHREWGRASRSHLPADWNDLIDEFVRARLLLRDSRSGPIRFWHQTIQEYFAACYVRDTLRVRFEEPQQLDVNLRPYIRDRAWHEILAIVAGLLEEEEARSFIDRLWSRDRLLAAMCLSNTVSYTDHRWTAWTQTFVTTLQRRVEWYGVTWQRAYPYLFVGLLGGVLWLVPSRLIESLPAALRHLLDLSPVLAQLVATALLALVGVITIMLLFRLYVVVLVIAELFAVQRYVQPGIAALKFIGDAHATRLLTHLNAVLADDFSIGNLTRATVRNGLLPRTLSIQELSMQLRQSETRQHAIETLGEMGTPAALRLLRDLFQERELDDRSHTSILRELVRNAKLTSENEPDRQDLEILLKQQLSDETAHYWSRREAYLALRELGVDAQAPRKGRWRAIVTEDLLVPVWVVRILLASVMAVVLAYLLSRCSG